MREELIEYMEMREELIEYMEIRLLKCCLLQ